MTSVVESNMLQVLLMLAVVLFYLIACPYTKVEESFNLQAMHDLIYHKTRLDLFDHLEFPGVVPRTFIGPLFVTFWVGPLASLMDCLGFAKDVVQILVRGCLGVCVVYVFSLFRVAVGYRYGRPTAFWLTIITATQFHLPFYASRPLPNVFALIPLMLAMHSWLVGNVKHFVWQAAFATVVFRSELVLLVGIIAAMEVFVSKRLSLKDLILHGVLAGVLSISLSAGVDSLFWRRPLWPEGEVLYYNTILNKSSDWGVSPFLWYFYSALPRALGPTLLLVPVGLAVDRRLTYLAIPALGFVFGYSFLPHKELRFVLYAVPLLNVVIARAADWVWINRSKNHARHCAALCLVAMISGNMTLSSLSFWASYYNYPGGTALRDLHQMEPTEDSVHVHMDWNVAQTGASRFLELNSEWRYSKEENLEPGGSKMLEFTHLIVGVNGSGEFNMTAYQHTHTIVKILPGFASYGFRWNWFPPLKIMLEPKVIILKRTVQSSVVLNSLHS